MAVLRLRVLLLYCSSFAAYAGKEVMGKMDRFTEAVKVVLGIEGGYVDDPDDRGGKTNLGITEATLQDAKRMGLVAPDVDIKNITKTQAIKIYRAMFWDAVKADKLPAPIDLIVFDCTVNHSPRLAGKLLQRALNTFSALPALQVDGIVGPRTLGAINRLVELDRQLNDVMPELGPSKLINDLARTILLKRARLFVDIAWNDQTQRKFLLGWLRRRVIELGEMVGAI